MKEETFVGNPEAWRALCLSVGEVEERMPFGAFAPRFASILAFYTLGHMFAFADVDDFTAVNVKVDPAEVDELHARYVAVDGPMNLSRRHWVSVRLGSDMDDAALRDLLRRAYGVVRRQYTKRPRAGRKKD